MTAFINLVLDFFRTIFPFRIVQPDEYGVRTFAGKVKKYCAPGVYIVLPFFGEVAKLNIMEQPIDLRPQSINSKDGKTVAVSGFISYDIKDVKLALFNVQDFDESLHAEALKVIAHFINSNDYADCTIKNITDELRTVLVPKARSKWGLNILEIGVTDLCDPKVFRIIGDSTLILENP